ncbi:hypothetical protein KC331_g52 [Hortaea werneckii]|nr:hypothetical protein KC331_g52 [Hortaea werneckii]
MIQESKPRNTTTHASTHPPFSFVRTDVSRFESNTNKTASRDIAELLSLEDTLPYTCCILLACDVVRFEDGRRYFFVPRMIAEHDTSRDTLM